MAFDFKKEYKEFYMPKNKPSIVEIPKMNYIAVRGIGNPNYLSYEEAKKITKLYADSENKIDIRKNAILHLFLHCGMRISEVANLNISDFQLSERKFLIFGKGNKERTGYLNEDTYNALKKYMDIRKNIVPKNKKDADKLFLSNKRTKINVSTIRRFIKNAYFCLLGRAEKAIFQLFLCFEHCAKSKYPRTEINHIII